MQNDSVNPADEPSFPLADIRVLDLSRAVSGPYVGRILADLGADVVKVEIDGTDVTQVFGPRSHGHSGLYVQQNAGKRNISIDLTTRDGPKLVTRLAATCQVVIENFRPGTVERLGVGWKVLSAANPELVMLSISGFGQWGPEAHRAAYAPVIHAESGLLGRQAQVDGESPKDIVFAAADSVAALHGAVAVLAAIHHVECTGVGQHIDLGMLEAMLATDDYVHYSLEDRLPVWPATGRIYNVVGGPLMIAGDAKVLWSRLTKFGALSDPDPNAALDAKLKTRVELIAQWVDSFPTRKQLIRSLEMAGLAWADVRTPDSVMQSPTVIARNISAQVDDREGGTRPVIRMPYRFSAAKSEPRGGAALVGEHNDEVMREWLGLGVDEVVELIASGALRITPGM